MITFMNKFIILAFSILMPSLAWAYEVKIGGIYYDLNFETKEATVVRGEKEYKRKITIPPLVKYKGNKYSVTGIGDSAFGFCFELTSVSIPSSVTSIGRRVFEVCGDLTTIQIDPRNPRYDSREDCNAIIETSTNTLVAGCHNSEIPEGITAIGECAFLWCGDLDSLYIPNSVTAIGESAFNFVGLSFLSIPSSVTTIGEFAFAECFGLTAIQIDPNNPRYDSREDCNAIIETSTNTLLFGCQGTVIPNSVTSIGDYAFASCDSLVSIVIPDGVTTLGDNVFGGGWDLQSITIGRGVKYIGKDILSLGCESQPLKTVYCLAEDVPETDSETFKHAHIFGTILYVPEESIDKYRASKVWSKFKEIRPLPSGK